MRKAPKIGQRVRFSGNSAIGPCVGVVARIFVQHEFDEDKSDQWNAVHGKPLPEREWHVLMHPDRIPEKWPYKGSDAFAPEVAELEPA